MNIWRYARSYDSDRSSPRTWMMGIVRNRCIDKLRLAASRPRVSSDVDVTEQASQQDVWTELAQNLTSSDVRSALGELPPEQRQTIELAYYGGLTQTEIAERMGVPLGTVKGRVRIGLDKLRILLASLEADLTS